MKEVPQLYFALFAIRPLTRTHRPVSLAHSLPFLFFLFFHRFDAVTRPESVKSPYRQLSDTFHIRNPFSGGPP